jgi:hypothetical protein
VQSIKQICPLRNCNNRDNVLLFFGNDIIIIFHSFPNRIKIKWFVKNIIDSTIKNDNFIGNWNEFFEGKTVLARVQIIKLSFSTFLESFEENDEESGCKALI